MDVKPGMPAEVRVTALATAVISVLALDVAVAQVPTEGNGADQISEIIVTARKREESLQDVPINITAFTQEVLERRNISSLADVAKLSSSLIVDNGTTPSGSRIVFRGLSPQRGRPNAAILVDGIDTTSEALTFVGSGMLAMERLLDLERIEIVKGPQSALYGRSAFNGAIQYVTKDPSDLLEGRVSFNTDNHELYDISAGISGPLSDTVGFRLNGNYWSERGYYREEATHSYVGGGQGKGAALTLKVTPTDSFSARARVSHVDNDYDEPAMAFVPHNLILEPPIEGTEAGVYAGSANNVYWGEVPSSEELKIMLSPDPRTGKPYPGSTSRYTRASLHLSWDVGVGTIDSWTGYTDADDWVFQDGERDSILEGPEGRKRNVALIGAEYRFQDMTQQFNQELRFSSAFDGPVQFTVGGLYWQEDARIRSANVGISCTPTRCPNENVSTILSNPDFSPIPTIRATRDIEHVSGYGLVEWQMTETVAVTAEVRLSHEEEIVQGLHCSLPTVDGVPCADPFDPGRAIYGPSTLLRNNLTTAPGELIASERSSNFATPRFTMQWTPVEAAMVYVSAAKGVKPGGTTTVTAGTWFDARSDFDISDNLYGPEKLWNYELGGKFEWLDRRLVTNAAIFKQDYTDKQVPSLVSTPSGLNATRILNAGAARLWGAELDVMYMPTDSLTLAAAYTWLDTEYTSFDVISDSGNEAIRNGVCNVVQVGEDLACHASLAGRKLENAPEHSLVLRSGYTAPAKGLSAMMSDDVSWLIELDGRFQDERFLDAANRKWLDSYWLANFRIGLTAESWEVLLYIDNLFDDRTVKTAQAQGSGVDKQRTNPRSTVSSDLVQVTMPDPRTYGLRATFNF